MKAIEAIFRAIDFMSVWVGKVASYTLIPLVLVIVYEVVSRYVFHAPTIFAHETGIYLYAFNGMMAGAWILLHEEHVKMDALYGHLPPRTKAILDSITAPLLFFFVSMVLWHGGIMARDSIIAREHTSSVWSPPWYPFKTIMPVAAFLLLLEGISKFRRDLFSAFGKKLS
jgi:TRAP-type mannitol/chloroaromatic compound transport system permease small subunit